MFADSLLIGFYWGLRAESLDGCADRVSALLQWLPRFNPSFRHLCPAPGTPAHQRSLRVSSSKPAVHALLNSGLTYPDVGNTPFYETGYRIGLWNKGENECMIHVGVNCGSVVNGIGNLCLLRIQPDTKAQRELCQSSQLEEICRTLIDLWDPENGTVTCNLLIDAVHPDAKIPDIGWYVYRRDRMHPQVSPTAAIRLLQLPDRGTLASSTCEITFPPSETAISSVRALFEAFGPATLSASHLRTNHE